MPSQPSFIQHCLDLLADLGPVKARAMFGGHGLSLHGVSLALIDDDRMYLRVDDQTRDGFAKAGGTPFTYPGKKGPMVMKSYYSLPEEAIDDPDEAVKWGRLSVEAGRRAEAAKRKPKAKAPATPKPVKAKPKAKAPVKAPAKKPKAKARRAS